MSAHQRGDFEQRRRRVHVALSCQDMDLPENKDQEDADIFGARVTSAICTFGPIYRPRITWTMFCEVICTLNVYVLTAYSCTTYSRNLVVIIYIPSVIILFTKKCNF